MKGNSRAIRHIQNELNLRKLCLEFGRGDFFFKASESSMHSPGLAAEEAKWYPRQKRQERRHFHRGRRQGDDGD